MQNFFWYPRKTDLEGSLITKTLHESNGSILSCRHYTYDKNGNIEKDWLLGNLTGRTFIVPAINEHGLPLDNGCEKYIKTFNYSDDGYNHLKYEYDGRKEIFYFYYPGSDLLHKKFISFNVVKYREFYSYDANGLVTKLVTDDGCSKEERDLRGVTERHITYIQYTSQNNNQIPIGLPQIVDEKYLDLRSGQEMLLKRIVNTYDHYGRIIQQEHFDSLAQYLFALYWKYDDHGNIIEEVNALGLVSTFRYDPNDNLIFEQHPGNPFYTEHEYDFSNRLICSKDIHPHSHQILSTHHTYNGLSQKVSTNDWYGQTTHFEYDRCGRLIKTTHPIVQDIAGHFYAPTESCEYDVADNPTNKIDLRGIPIKIAYNTLGKPYLIQYCDGSIEKNEYTLDGLLEKSIARNGTSTHIDYDYLGRPCKQEIYSSSGVLLSQTQTLYSHYHKLLEIDPNGNQTHYQYDYAGRLTSITKAETKTIYQYDTCQRVSKVLEYFGPSAKDYIVKAQEYDAMGKIIEERAEDADGNVLTKTSYAYNERGERIQTISYNQPIPTITTTSYNAYGDIEAVTDPEGHITRTIFYYDYVNSSGQNVFAKEIIDPMGLSTFQENDALGRLRYQIKKDSMGIIHQKCEFFYDAGGLCVKRVDHVFTPNQADRIITTLFEYDFDTQLIRCVEAAGTPEQKQTSYEYNSFRQKIIILKPDGTKLHHAYDELGRLYNFRASDDSFHYQYDYDANSNVIRVDDIKENKTTLRTFDACNRLVEETLLNDLIIRYDYDYLGRVRQLTLPDKSKIDYIYKSLHLFQIQRGSYIHTYQAFNLSGLVENALMIGNTGQIQFSYDACQRLTLIDTPYWQEKIPSDGFDSAGNLIKKTTLDSLGKLESRFTYDPLYQLQTEEGVGHHTFLHDSLYNLIQQDESRHLVNALHQLLHDGSEEHLYDLNGNLIHKGELTLAYDALDRLVTIETPSQKVIYTYDELNRRLSSTHYSKDISGEFIQRNFVRYIFTQQNEIGACDESGQIQQLRILGIGKGAENWCRCSPSN